jgi:hypothetical protein
MLVGHVDHISHGEIAGWAADEARPDDTIKVSIFVDGHKRAQLDCDLPRPDLLQTSIWGRGRHGFRFRFPAALERGAMHRVSVCFTASGRPLDGGEAKLSPDGTTITLQARRRAEAEALFALPTPSTPQDTLQMFSAFDQAYGLSDLLARADFTGRQPPHIRYSVFGVLPANGDASDEFTAGYAPRDHLNELLMSAKFQQELVTLLLNAFPEKRRLLFVHIPKCAGSDLSRHLMTRYPSVEERWMEERWTSKDALFAALHDLVLALPLFDSIFVRGHIRLNWYLDRGLARPIDRLFTIMRHPVEIAVSQANYVMMRIAEDQKSGKVGPDTQQWLGQLGLAQIPHRPLADLAEHVCHKVLRTREIVIANPLCHWLGGGDAATVLERLAECGAEVTETCQYNRWLSETWGIESATRLNESPKFISQVALDRDELDYLSGIFAEDIKLFGTVQQRLAGLGTSWLVGSQLHSVKG